MDLSIALAAVLAVALIVAAFANAAHASNNADLADELDTAKEALDAAAHTLSKVVGGMPLPQALAELPQDPEAVDAFKKTLAFFKKATPAALLLVALVGCASPVTRARIEHLEKAIKDERRAVVVRVGFEADVMNLRDAEDADIAAMESATR